MECDFFILAFTMVETSGLYQNVAKLGVILEISQQKELKCYGISLELLIIKSRRLRCFVDGKLE